MKAIKTNFRGLAHLKSLSKLVAHDVVEQRVDAGGEEVEDAGRIVEDAEHVVEPLGLDARGGAIDGHQALGVEGGPADEECHGHCHWKMGGRVMMQP